MNTLSWWRTFTGWRENLPLGRYALLSFALTALVFASIAVGTSEDRWLYVGLTVWAVELTAFALRSRK